MSVIERAWPLAALAIGLAGSSDARAEDAKPPIEVTVIGDAGQPAARDPTGASYVIREDRLRTPGVSAADVLTQVPGVQVARTGSSSDLATASIRGATSAQTPVYIAGVRINDDVTGTADLSLAPLWMLRRIEVYRSGAPADADRLGIGGAIFCEPVLPRGTRILGGLGIGSFGENALWAASAVGDERAGAMVAIRRQSAVNDYAYVDDHGTTFDPRDDRVRTRQNADFVAYDIWGIGRFRAGRATINVITNGLSRDQGVTGLSVMPARSARAHTQRGLGAVTATVPCGSGDACTVQLVTSLIVTRSGMVDPLRELSLLAPWVTSAGERLSQQARLRYHVGDVISLGLGASQDFERLSIDQPDAAEGRACRSTSRASATLVASVSRRLELNALAAAELHATRGSIDPAHDVFEPTARAGASLHLAPGADLLANVGRYARVPTLGETYGISPVVRGNPDLAPEHGFVADLGARVSRSWAGVYAYANAFGFARFASDLVGFRLSSLGVIRPYNVASARVLGLELDAGVTIVNHVRTELALTVLDPRDTSPDRRVVSDLLRFQARLVTAPSVELYWEHVPEIALDRASLTARLSYRASRAADPAGLVVLPAQAPVDVELSLLFWKRRLATRFSLSNVFDAPMSDVIGLPLPGRSVHGSMEVWW